VECGARGEGEERDIGTYTLHEYEAYLVEQGELGKLEEKSLDFKSKWKEAREWERRQEENVISRDAGIEVQGYEGADPELVEKVQKSGNPAFISLFNSWSAEREEKEKNGIKITDEQVEEEKKRRVRMAQLEHAKPPGRYGGDPIWDDVQPMKVEEGGQAGKESVLARIAYDDEYAEGTLLMPSHLITAISPQPLCLIRTSLTIVLPQRSSTSAL